MKSVTTKPCAQGDMLFIPVSALGLDTIPDGVEEMKTEGKYYVVGHSETGHHHVIEKERAKVFEETGADAEFTGWIRSLGPKGAEVEHQRSFDTHEALHLPPGDYQIRRQRQHVPEGFRRVAD